ncbi:DUF3108 domain-containing protein [Rickettsiales bacterium]|nr:DUF3108 domain-containing protein [Rickettsiales bacterium]
MKKIIYIFSIICLLTYSKSSFAATDDTDKLQTAPWYKVYWGGFHIANLWTEITDGQIKAVIESYGLVKTLSKYESSTKSSYIKKDNRFLPAHFQTIFKQRHGSRSIDIKYNDSGNIKDEAVIPPDNRLKRPAVEDAKKKNAVDPLTAILVARQKIKNGLKNGNDKFSINMYDGRRLSELDFTIYGKQQKTIKNRQYDVIKIDFKRLPIEGYTDNELKRFKSEEPVFTLYLEDNDLMLPIKAEADAPLGTAVLLMEKDCLTLSQCNGGKSQKLAKK